MSLQIKRRCVKNQVKMSKPNEFGVGLMHEFVITAAKVGWTPQDLARLTKDEQLLRMFYLVMEGHAEVVRTTNYFINCNAVPMLPISGSTVEVHKRDGTLKWNELAIELHSDETQKFPQNLSKMALGIELLPKLSKLNVLNANVLDYLIMNPILIPEQWKEKKINQYPKIFFWGTIYKNFPDSYVRYLEFDGVGWRAGTYGLHYAFNEADLAAVRIG